ncbi:hypothetical protein F5Y11DRAFT_33588 [Daldinia sp. FL1419]|nr:hypothetical protein F5Y11DRAFT_33588 [Daldinia sp. FL1419]
MVTLPSGIKPGSPTSTRGRSVLASATYSPGALITVFDGQTAPSIAIPDSYQLSRTCHYCLAIASGNDPTTPSPVSVRACTGCRAAYYCSTACQKLDWALGHGNGECKCFRRVRTSSAAEAEANPSQTPMNPPLRDLPTPIRALVQVLVRPEMRAAFNEMEGHRRAHRTAEQGKEWERIAIQAHAAFHYMNRKPNQADLEEAMEIVCKLKINSFDRLDVDIGQSGTFVNPALAMVNHSCVPNAFVQFIGRKAVLHAYREIQEGEEIVISYIDFTLPRLLRQKALKRYYFECVCPRCAQDLDIYQVCQRYPHLELNSFSLVIDLEKLRHPPIEKNLRSNSSLQKYIKNIYPECTAPLQGLNLPEKTRHLRHRWKMCAQIRQAKLYAVEPLSQAIVEGSICFCEQGNFPYALSVSSFLALESDPYRGPMPFHGPRVKGMLMVAKLLANTAADSLSSPSGGTGISARLLEVLSKMDQATMCQVILAMVIHYCPAAHSKEWVVYHQANDLLKDIERLPGRETENVLINAFVKNPTGSEEVRFFNMAVLEPIQKLAGFALEIMDSEFGV